MLPMRYSVSTEKWIAILAYLPVFIRPSIGFSTNILALYGPFKGYGDVDFVIGWI